MEWGEKSDQIGLFMKDLLKTEIYMDKEFACLVTEADMKENEI